LLTVRTDGQQITKTKKVLVLVFGYYRSLRSTNNQNQKSFGFGFGYYLSLRSFFSTKTFLFLVILLKFHQFRGEIGGTSGE